MRQAGAKVEVTVAVAVTKLGYNVSLRFPFSSAICGVYTSNLAARALLVIRQFAMAQTGGSPESVVGRVGWMTVWS